MHKIRNLIHSDLITMNGGKNNMRMLCILLLLVFGTLGFIFSPLFGLYCPLIMSGFFVSMLFQNEVKYHGEKMYGLLPIDRRDLVRARFLFLTVLYTVLFLIFYLIMLLSLHLKPYYLLMGEDAEMMDVMKMIAQNSAGAFSEFGVFNVLYFAAYSIGMIYSTRSLRKYFKSTEKTRGTMIEGTRLKKASKEEILFGIFVLVIIFLPVLIITDILSISAAILPVLQLFMQLAEAANGFLLAAVFVAVACFSATYKYICAVLEYDVKEL